MDPSPTLCLVCSSGGHLYELLALRDLWGRYPRFWVTFRNRSSEQILSGESVRWAHQPTNRSLVNLIRNFVLALRLLRRDKPDLIVSSGAGVSVPFICAARLLGRETVYIESLARVGELSLSAKLVYPFVGRLLVQWPELAARYKKAEFWGQVL